MPNSGRSRDFIENITLYDQRKIKIGHIYPRRAKQLVLRGRAVWLDEGQALQMMPDIDVTDSSSTIIEEEETMIDDIYPTNDGSKAMVAASKMDEADSLLMYQAKQNVKDKKNLVKHVLAFIAAWPVLGIFYEAAIQDMVSPNWWRVSRAIQNISAHIANDYMMYVDELRWAVEWHFRRGYTPGIWYVLLGVMLAWGSWIAIRVLRRVSAPVARKMRSIFSKKTKLDPVIEEYNRLKSLSRE